MRKTLTVCLSLAMTVATMIANANEMETMTIDVKGPAGCGKPQVFTKKAKGTILSFLFEECKPSIVGVVRLTGQNTDIVILTINASGYCNPGEIYSSRCTFKVIH